MTNLCSKYSALYYFDFLPTHLTIGIKLDAERQSAHFLEVPDKLSNR